MVHVDIFFDSVINEFSISVHRDFFAAYISHVSQPLLLELKARKHGEGDCANYHDVVNGYDESNQAVFDSLLPSQRPWLVSKLCNVFKKRVSDYKVKEEGSPPADDGTTNHLIHRVFT